MNLIGDSREQLLSNRINVTDPQLSEIFCLQIWHRYFLWYLCFEPQFLCSHWWLSYLRIGSSHSHSLVGTAVNCSGKKHRRSEYKRKARSGKKFAIQPFIKFYCYHPTFVFCVNQIFTNMLSEVGKAYSLLCLFSQWRRNGGLAVP